MTVDEMFSALKQIDALKFKGPAFYEALARIREESSETDRVELIRRCCRQSLQSRAQLLRELLKGLEKSASMQHANLVEEIDSNFPSDHASLQLLLPFGKLPTEYLIKQLQQFAAMPSFESSKKLDEFLEILQGDGVYLNEQQTYALFCDPFENPAIQRTIIERIFQLSSGERKLSVNVNSKNDFQESPYFMSLSSNPELAFWLLRNFPDKIMLHSRGRSGKTLLHEAATKCSAEFFVSLLEAGHARLEPRKFSQWISSVDDTPAHIPVLFAVCMSPNYNKILRPFLDFHRHPEIKDAHGRTVLHFLYTALQAQPQKILDVIRLGIPIDAKDANGVPLVYYAAYDTNAELERALLQAGADTSAVDSDGNAFFNYKAKALMAANKQAGEKRQKKQENRQL